MATTQFVFAAIDGSVPAIDSRSATQTTLTPSGSNQQTTAVGSEGSPWCEVSTDTAVFVSFGANPDASSDSVRFLVPAGGVKYYRVSPGAKGAVVLA